MNWPEVVRDLTRRLDTLNRIAVRYRQGEITSLSPLSVDLGGSGIPYTSVRALPGSALAIGDVVAVLTWGNDLLVLGRVKADRSVPSARVYNSAAISAAHNATVMLTFNSERWDSDNIHSTSLNTSRLTCVTPGLYTGLGQVAIAASATGVRQVFVRINSGTLIANDVRSASSAFATELAVPFIWRLAAGDYIELGVFQNSGAARDVTAEFGMAYLGP